MKSLSIFIARYLVAASTALLLLGGCGSDAGTGARRERAVPVTVVAAYRADVPYTLSAVGNVEAYASVEVKSRVGGIIDEQLVHDGQEVEKGSLLFRIDPRSFDLAIMEAQAELDRDRAHLTKAREDLKRYSKLREMNVVAQGQYDDTFAEATSLENTIRLNQAALAKARLDREYAGITAPIPGRVGIVQVNVGNVIKANDDRTLCVINQVRPINISFSLPERYLGEVRARLAQGELPVSVTPSGEGSRSVVATLSAVDNSVDTATGAIRLMATHPNDDYYLWPGQFARVSLTLKTMKNALLVPSQAVMQGLNGPYVYVVVPDAGDNAGAGVAQARDVAASHAEDGNTVVEQGLESGELVVLDGQVGLAPGTKVVIKERRSPDAKPAPAPAVPAGEGAAQ